MKKIFLLLSLILASNQLSAQFYEGFENTTGPDALPSTNWTLGSGNWAVFDNVVGQGERWKINNSISVPPSPQLVYQGANSAYVSRENIGLGNTSEDYLATPLITIPANGVLSFYSRSFTSGDQGTIYQIKIAPSSAQQNNPSAYTLWAEFTENELNSTFNIYEAKFVDLSAYVGTSIYIAFVRKYNQTSTVLDGDRWLVDGVSVNSNLNCLINNSCANTIVLSAFVDSNNNGIKDVGEVPFNKGNFIYQVNDSGTNLSASSNYGEFYLYNPILTSSYDISYTINSNYSPYFTCSTVYTDFISNINASILYFPIIQTNSFIDAEIYFYTQIPPRPGFNNVTTIFYRNNGFNTITNGTLTYVKDPNLTINSISQSGIVATPTGFTYDFTNLLPNEVRTIYVAYLIPTIPTVSLGQLVNHQASIQVPGDFLISNDTDLLTQAIVASWDPNDITESHGERIVWADFGADEYLHYTIRFENTGTAAAEFIRVIDELDNQLDETTFELIGASHNVDAIRNGTQLIFNFNHINLPPSSINIEDGHGYVQYRIKPKPGYALGDIIPNTASIYFDFNPAIVTNTFNTEFVENLGTDSFETNSIRLYPNPAQDFITISNLNGIISTVNIFEISGKRIFNMTENLTTEINISTSEFAKGMYLVEIITEDNHKINKKLIIK